jgi:hypothetical protein
MIFNKNVLVAVFFIVIFGVATASAQDSGWNALGLRAGIDDGRNDEDLTQFEAFALYDLPWNWKLGSDWQLATAVEMNAGALHGGGDTAFVGSAGPALSLLSPAKTFVLLAGINPTVISEDNIGDEELGGPLQFTSHIGLSYTIQQRLIFGYRYQHMSNAGIYSANPGVNMHMLEIGFRF